MRNKYRLKISFLVLLTFASLKSFAEGARDRNKNYFSKVNNCDFYPSYQGFENMKISFKKNKKGWEINYIANSLPNNSTARVTVLKKLLEIDALAKENLTADNFSGILRNYANSDAFRYGSGNYLGHLVAFKVNIVTEQIVKGQMVIRVQLQPYHAGPEYTPTSTALYDGNFECY